MRIATFNLLHGRSLGHGGVEVADLRAAAREIDADVLALQEVDNGQARSGAVDQTAEVAAALGAENFRFEATVGDTYGVGLVSRWPVTSWSVRRFARAPVELPLLIPGRGLTRIPDEPRAGIAAVLETPLGPLTVVATHLSFAPGWNVAQLRALASWATTFPGPRLLIGDFNLPGPVVRAATRRWTQLARVPTYPSWRPRVQLDHVLAHGIDESVVHEVQALSLPVSDHCALVVDLVRQGIARWS